MHNGGRELIEMGIKGYNMVCSEKRAEMLESNVELETRQRKLDRMKDPATLSNRNDPDLSGAEV